MNLIHLHQKGDPVLELGEGVTVERYSVAGRTYDGFLLPSGPAGELKLKSALRWHPFASRPVATDWLAVATMPLHASSRPWSRLGLRRENRLQNREGDAVELEAALVDDLGQAVSRSVDLIGGGPSVVSLPRLAGPSTLERDRSLTLVLRNRAIDGSSIMLLVAEADSAKRFLALAKGTGAELLGAGGTLLTPAPDRDLFYVGSEPQIAAIETASPVSSWSQALVGGSHDIPIVDDGLDFILANSLLHRTVNPLGHLANWRTKLRTGGRVLGIVPYVAGGSDYLNAPTTMDEWMAQYTNGGFEEMQAHHDAFARARGLNPKSLFRRRHPSSFSFFTPANVADMLKFAIDRLGYEGMHIEHARNGRHIRFGLYA
jgi:hypothetical protein